jgi:hypothetical protein
MRCDDRVPSYREGKDDHTRREVAKCVRHDAPRLLRIEQARVGQAGIPSFGDAQDGGRLFRFLRAQCGTAARAAFTGGKVEDAGAMAWSIARSKVPAQVSSTSSRCAAIARISTVIVQVFSG